MLIQVWDTGVGIAPELRETVFTEFTRGAGGSAASPGNEGLGLGLAIVRRLTDLLHGDISLRSVTGKGSVFSLWLPAGIPGAHADVYKRQPMALSERESGCCETSLRLEDSVANTARAVFWPAPWGGAQAGACLLYTSRCV